MKNNEFRMIRADWIEYARYNRKVDEKRVKHIAKNFDDRLFGQLVVSNRGKKTYVIDGQHRLRAAIEKGIKEVPCIVLYGLDEKEEADLYIQYNKERVALKPYDYFEARCVAGEPKALDIKDTVESAGFSIRSGADYLQCIQSIEKYYDSFGKYALFDALKIIKKAWPDNRQARQRNVILAVVKFIKENNGNIDQSDLAKRLSKVNIGNFLAESRNAITGCFDSEKSSDALMAIYNKGRRKKVQRSKA